MITKNRFPTKLDRIAELEWELNTAKVQLAAWHSQFGTTQLSHAVEKFRLCTDTLNRQQAELERFKKQEREFPTHHSQDGLSPELRTW